MINWRKPVITAALLLTRSDIPTNLRTIREIERTDRTTVHEYRNEKLRRLLRHAHRTVPYYNEILEEAGVVRGGEVHLDRFTEVPLLTKDTLRGKGNRLRSVEPGPDPYTNTSGGTTGEPVEFVQDRRYWEWNVANKISYQELAGKPLGGREVKLWGSERDTFQGRELLQTRLRNHLYNRRLLNSFRMSETDMREYVEVINSFRPHTIWAYVESMHQLALFVQREDLDVHSPNGIVTTAGTLHEPVRERIETVFDATVHNQYGSREVGDIACECAEQEGLHTFPHTHRVEIVDEDGDPVPPGEQGEIVITVLTNRTMPFIRYRIGDVGRKSEEYCPCGRPFEVLDEVAGRVTDHFVSNDDALVHGEFFTHLFYGRSWVRKFQIRQRSTEEVVIYVVPESSPNQSDLHEIEDNIVSVLGEETTVRFDFVNAIPPSDSGKYSYTISDVEV